MLLWRVKIDRRQKIGLGIMLSLSLVTAILSVASFSGVHLRGEEVDIVWLAFWQHQECCVAVVMVSIVAFRSFFVSKTQRVEKSPRYTSTYWKRRVLGKKSDASDESIQNGLPSIPSATLTGMRTYIGEKGVMETMRDQSCDQSHDRLFDGEAEHGTPIQVSRPQVVRVGGGSNGQVPKFACSTINSVSTPSRSEQGTRVSDETWV